MADQNEQDPWKSIHQLLGGKTPFIRIPESMQGGEWVQSMINDIVKRTMDSVAGSAGYSPTENPPRQTDPRTRKTASPPDSERARSSANTRSSSTPVRPAPYAGGNPAISTTDKAVIVRYRLPDKTEAEKLRLFADVYTLRLEGLPGGRKPSIPLPCPVKIQGASARLNGENLTIRLPRSSRIREQEIFIHY
ncbi:Hsp20/alpha crystallin family protein [Gorillibacterium timonense]|uniref:hypothetical protein n=1 Tax=Gorillibacterium timonense TaxID=1689269 RepID=UPI00071C8199|nr:hypothetical protein [Gorillibacterium timonense]